MKRIKKAVISAVLCLSCLLWACGCRCPYVPFLDGEDISRVRERAAKLKTEFAETIVECFQEKDAEGIMALLCPKTRKISDIRAQIENRKEF